MANRDVDYELKRAAQRRINNAPELKAPPSWLEDAVASLRRGLGRGMTEGVPYSVLNMISALKGEPEIPSAYDRRQGIFHEPEPTTTIEDIASMVADPTNIIGGAMLKPVARAVRKAIPAVATVGSAAYAGDTEAGGGLSLLRKALTGQLAKEVGTTSVIKEKGGNWLSGSVEGALSGLKKPEAGIMGGVGHTITPETAEELGIAAMPQYLQRKAINNFIDKQLTRYVKNEMATPQDPVRALAERGILHVDPNTIPIRNLVHPSGEETRKLGVSEAAKRWENRSDRAIAFNPASDYQDFGHSNMTREHPWVAKLDPTTPMYRYNTGISTQDLGFDHLIDELSNALNPESGLPRNLLLDPKSIERVSVPQAVERVAKINEWRAAQKAEADAMLANNAATVLHKEYPGQPYKWVELKKQELPAGWVQEGSAYADPSDPKAKWIYPEEALADALKYEGDTMGHCVGGYCDDVASGRSRIYSLRDAKGQPHVTIEVSPEDFDPATMSEEQANMLRRARKSDAPRIVQIKGKQNRAPNPEYLPFVQDFVKSGQWSDVGDLQNTGLRNLVTLGDEPMVRAARERLGNYATDAEWDAFSNEYLRSRPNFASGGQVKNSLPDFTNPAIITAIFKELQHG